MKILQAVSFGLLALCMQAQAQINSPYTTDLQKCLVTSLSDSDKIVMQNMILQTFFAHPNFYQKNPFSEHEISQNDKKLGELFTRLIVKDCAKEFALAIKYDGKIADYYGFEAMGKYAFMELVQHPDVLQRSQNIEKYIDRKAIDQVIEKFNQPKNAK